MLNFISFNQLGKLFYEIRMSIEAVNETELFNTKLIIGCDNGA